VDTDQKNNFVGLQNNYVERSDYCWNIRIFCDTIFKVSTKLFWWVNKIIFRSISSKIWDLSAKSFFPCTIGQVLTA